MKAQPKTDRRVGIGDAVVAALTAGGLMNTHQIAVEIGLPTPRTTSLLTALLRTGRVRRVARGTMGAGGFPAKWEVAP